MVAGHGVIKSRRPQLKQNGEKTGQKNVENVSWSHHYIGLAAHKTCNTYNPDHLATSSHPDLEN